MHDCIIWGGTTHRGYGVIWEGRRKLKAHRRAWELLVGPLPEGPLHHLCEQKLCVNVFHLSPVTPSEHSRIHNVPRVLCPKCGSDDWERNGQTTKRRCRVCRNARRRELRLA